MATINQGIMGGFSGRVGTVVGGRRNGIDYMRAKRSDVKDAKSDAQENQRARLVTVIHFLKPFRAFFPVGFKNRKNGLSPFNAAVSCNMQEALVGVYPDFSIDYSRLKVSKGSMPGALNPAVINSQTNELIFTWEDNCDQIGAMANDRVALLVYDPQKKKSISLLLGNSRMTGSQALTLPDGFGGENLQCYIAFRNLSQTNISDSQYVGSISL